MLKYVDTLVTFSEVPDEISLCINISGCTYKCPGCHSPWLWEDIGTPLDKEELERLIDKHDGITCVCFMGGTPKEVSELAKYCKGLAVAYYTGADTISEELDLKLFDYIKTGPYIAEYGPLTSRRTNQTMWKVNKEDYTIHDITDKFWK